MTVHQIEDELSGQKLVVDPEIPGQVGWNELLAIGRLARGLTQPGVIVEVGAMFGRSSFAWAKNAPSSRVISIDPFVREPWIVELVERPQNVPMPFSIAAHRFYTSKCFNITRLKGYSPDVGKGWSTPIDIYFDDGDSSTEGLKRNFDFWEPFVKTRGIICGSHADAPATLALVRKYELKWNVTANVTADFWSLRKP